MARDFISIAGDQDRRLVELHARGPGASARMDYRQLGAHHFAWLSGLPSTRLYQGDVLLCHGTPRSDAHYWLEGVTDEGRFEPNTLAAIEAEAEGVAASLILCGHSHIPRVVRLGDGRTVVNPGSVGCPGYRIREPVAHTVHTGTPDACYAILERTPRGWSATLRYVPYDHLAMADLARRNGAPEWASALATGWID